MSLALGMAVTLLPGAARGQSPRLHAVTSTMTQIVLRWDDPFADAVGYELQRAIDPTFQQDLRTYSLGASVRMFADTGRDPLSKQRFTGEPGLPLLDPDVTYYYRVRVLRSAGETALSKMVTSRLSAPVRGKEGDLWADVVLGKPDFAQNVVGRPNRYGASMPGGIILDRSTRPNAAYIADCNNNRILAFRSLGVCELGIPDGGNRAEGMPYAPSQPPPATYGDEDGEEFTDGILSTTWANSFGYPIPHGGALLVDVDVDLGAPREINFAVYSTGGGTPNYRAGSVAVLVSDDGAEWTKVGHAENEDNEPEIRSLFDPVETRYVRFRGTSQPFREGSVTWFFIGEGMVARLADAAVAERGSPCTGGSDCHPGNFCRLTPERGADLVIGQPGFDNLSAGNADSTAQTFPYRGPANAATLCLTLPTQISMAETITSVSMATGADGTLYVPDIFNNRVLRYETPFAADTVADQVWGRQFSATAIRTVDTHVKRIRRKLASDNYHPWSVASVWGVGYEFEVEP